jgi:NADH-quinone oxidoreductase E subunit
MSTKELVQELVKKHGKDRSALLPVLNGIQEKERHLSQEAMIEVAKAFDISGAEVFGTASFYHFFAFKPRGKYIIRVCKTIVCDMKGKQNIIDQIKQCLGIGIGETTSDGLFTLEVTNCLGQCDKAPAMLINDKVYTELNPDKIREILKSYKLKNK